MIHDPWMHTTSLVLRLQVAVVCLSIACAATGGALAWQFWQGAPIHYIPAGGPGLSRPGVIPDTYATDFAAHLLERRYTFTPSTIKRVHLEVEEGLHPSLSVAFRVQADKEALAVKEYKMSSQMTVQKADVIHRTADTVVVTLSGLRAVWIGGAQVREEPVQAEIHVQAWFRHGRPMGVVASTLRVDPALTVVGK